MNKIETNVVKPEVSIYENEENYLILESEFETNLDSKISEIENFMKNNTGKDKEEEEKDKLYESAKSLWVEYATILRDIKYNLYLNREQYKFLTDTILTKLEYDVDTVFYAIELTDMLGNMKVDSKYKSDSELIGYPIDATEITYIYHLIKPFKIKGLTKTAYIFSQVLMRIGGISKIFNYYDTYGKNLSKEIQDWVISFEPGVKIEDKHKVEDEATEKCISLNPENGELRINDTLCEPVSKEHIDVEKNSSNDV